MDLRRLVPVAWADWTARWTRLPMPVRLAWVAGGYLAALALAALVVFIVANLTDSPDRAASSGMHAFSDALMFVCIFALGAVVPTGLLLISLRPIGWLWVALSWLALAFALTGVWAVLDVYRTDQASGQWSALSVLRLFMTPIAAGAFTLVGLASPHRASRWRLCAAVLLEVCAGAYGLVHWFLPLLLSR